MNLTTTLGLGISFTFVVACSAGEGTAGSGHALTDGCSGEYSCTDGTQSVTSTLTYSNGVCHAGNIGLQKDGSVSGLVSSGTWSGDSNGFSICSGSQCLVCTPSKTTGGSGGSSSSAKCTGAPMSCYSLSPGSCSSVEGCYMHSHYTGSHWENECLGSAKSCDSFSSESLCQEQGCTWK